jgi:hypothetical protein
MEENADTHDRGNLVEGDPTETSEQERERRGDESPERTRARIRGGLGAGEGANDEPAAGEGINRGLAPD